MKVRTYIKNNWNYIIAFLIPWILVVIHSFVWNSWLTGNGSILYEDASSIYYEMYMQLWDKVHNGGSLFFTWNAGGGMDFLTNIFNYMSSPFTLILLILPKKMIADALQFFMIFKWSLAALTSVYYFEHTDNNRISEHRKLISMVMAFAFVFGNALIYDLSKISMYDVIILFPLILLEVEKAAQGERRKLLFILPVLGYIFNWRTMLSVSIFLVFWFWITETDNNKKKGNTIFFAVNIILSLISAMLVIIPGYMVANGSMKMAGYKTLIMMPLADLFKRFFVFDTLLTESADEPMLYCSIVIIYLALNYIFIPVSKKERAKTIFTTVLLLSGMFFGAVNLFWHGGIGMGDDNSFSFLLIFMLIYMAFRMMEYIDRISIIKYAVVLIAGIGCMAYAFFRSKILSDFYVYLVSVMVFVFVFLMVMFCRKKSIKYKNVLIVLSIVCVGELAGNLVFQFSNFNYYPIKDMYYHSELSVLANRMDMDKGERVAASQTEPNYGLAAGLPLMSGRLEYCNYNMEDLCSKLGAAQTDHVYNLNGSTPLSRLMFNISYVLDSESALDNGLVKEGSNGDYFLYETGDNIGSGYMVDDAVTEWNVDDDSPFEVQNDFALSVTGKGGLFEELTPEFVVYSLTGGKRHENTLNGVANVLNPHDRRLMTGQELCIYEENTGRFRYKYVKMYDEDYLQAYYESDGVSDYYVFLDSDNDLVSYINIDGETVYVDSFPEKRVIYHIGKVEKGKRIEIVSDAQIDNVATGTVYYRIAAFDDGVYQELKESLASQVLDIDEWKDTYISGTVDAAKSGILMTSIPALKGFEVFVDGDKAAYETIGNALIGIPLNKGEHRIELSYKTPGLMYGLCAFIIAVICYFIVYSLYNRDDLPKTLEADKEREE